MNNDFNALHPMYKERERGWKAEPNPFVPKAPRPGHTYIDKHIFIYADQLWYDIDATTYLVGKARRGNQTNQEEMVPTSENNGERPLFYRWFDKYVQKAENLLSAYLMKPEGRVKDNTLREWSEKEIWLRMPDYWDDTRYDALTKAIHTYLAAGAMYEYFLLTLTSKDPLTIDKYNEVEDAEHDIIDAANATKAGGMIHTLKPFG